MIVAFCVPWWGVKITRPTSASLAARMQSTNSELAEYQQKEIDNRGWYGGYKDIYYEGGFSRRMLTMQAGETVTVYIWGWHTVGGILALAFGIVIAGTMAVMTLVPQLARFSWIASAASAVLGIPIFILGLVWWVTAPTADFKPIISQYVVAGPLMCVLGGLGVLGLGVTGFVQGLLAFLRTPRPAAAAPPAWAPPPHF